MNLRAGDIVCTRGTSWLSRAIRFATRSVGESRTQINHVGLVVKGGPLLEAVIVEALSTVKMHKLGEAYGGTSHEVAILRPLNMPMRELGIVASEAKNYVGRSYGYLKLVLHGLDYMLLGAYVFRRLARMDRYPICSWLVAACFARVKKFFGVAPGAAQPDDIWDYALSHPAVYKVQRELARL